MFHPKPEILLGVSADYHDAAAALVVEGEIVAAAEEERFSRVKHDPSIPVNAIAWCLNDAGVPRDGLTGVVFYDKPLTTYERILATHAKVGPHGFLTLADAVRAWSTSKLWVAPRLDEALHGIGYDMAPLTYAEHHQGHAASAFYPSPFDSAAVLTLDGVGEWATSSISHGRGSSLKLVRELHFPDSVGLLYSAMTAYCGFAVNEDEYKLMGLAPYGEPRFAQTLLERVVELAEDGSIRLDQRWFDYRSGRRMTRPGLGTLLDGPPRSSGQPITQREADIARSVQVVVEEIVLRMARHAHELTGERRVCLAGGVALNCVANARLLDDGPFDEVWVQPAAGDSGGALGAALWEYHNVRGRGRLPNVGDDGMSGSRLGPHFHGDEIAEWLRESALEFVRYADRQELYRSVATELDNGAIVGWFQGRMEFGPRALGGRSILADARAPNMTQRLNDAVKKRESFRPFAPAVLEEVAHEWFDVDRPSPYMLFTAQVTLDRRLESRGQRAGSFAERLGEPRSQIPACTHVDYSARLQTVGPGGSDEFRRLLEAFDELTGCPVLLNTSFNQGGEPIVRTPADAMRCFEQAGLDLLVLEDCVVHRSGASWEGGDLS